MDFDTVILVTGKADGPTSVFLAGRLGSLFCILALLIMAIFYGIYFTKKIAQKRRGIQTTQLGRGKEKSVRRIERIMSVATFLIIPVELISIFLGWNHMPPPVRIAGVVIGLTETLFFLLQC